MLFESFMLTLLRALVGLLVGATCGAVFGAAGFAAGDALFTSGRHLGIFDFPLYILGVVFVGVPGAVVGAVTGGANLGPRAGAALGAALGALICLLMIARKTGTYSLPSGKFDKQFFFLDLVTYATWLGGLSVVGLVCSASVRRLFAVND